jgi:hypothetical protein
LLSVETSIWIFNPAVTAIEKGKRLGAAVGQQVAKLRDLAPT